MNTSETSQNFQEELVTLLPRLRRFARNLTRSPHDADDMVQIAVERAITRAEQRLPDTRLDGWMFKIVRNAWIDEVRSRVRRDKIFAPQEAGEQIGNDAIEQEATLMSVQTAMLRLPEEQRVAVSLVLVEGLSYKEAAEVLEVPIGTLTSRLARGRQALQALLGSEGEIG
jgi:RNA polymerase sigma-70 factor (ECF subfamily)